MISRTLDTVQQLDELYNNAVLFGYSSIEYDNLLLEKNVNNQWVLKKWLGKDSVSQIQVPFFIEVLDKGVFAHFSRLEHIEFEEGSNLKVIDDGSFVDCKFLISIEIPNTCERIGNLAFKDCCNLASLKFGYQPALQEIGEEAFANCISLLSVEVTGMCSKIGKRAFYACTKLSSVRLNCACEVIEEDTFKACRSLAHLELPNKLKKILGHSFSYTFNLKKIEFPKTLVQLGPCSFMNSGLTNVRFNGESLHILGTKAFQYCHNLRKVSLPKQIDKRGRKVFNGCYYLEKSMQRSKLCHLLV